jgi:integrase
MYGPFEPNYTLSCAYATWPSLTWRSTAKLRACDLVALRVDDVAPYGYAIDRANVRQRKTGRPVRFELTEQTRQSLDAYLRSSSREPGQVLFPGRGGSDRSLTTRQYARLVERWVASVGLDPRKFAHAFNAPDEGDPDLPSHGEFASGPAVTRSYADRKHRTLPRR